MKNIFEIIKPKTDYKGKKLAPQPKKIVNYKRQPTPLETHDPYHGICRILPHYFAKNYQYFELITPPKQKIKDWDAYLLRLKQKITCMKAEILL